MAKNAIILNTKFFRIIKYVEIIKLIIIIKLSNQFLLKIA